MLKGQLILCRRFFIVGLSDTISRLRVNVSVQCQFSNASSGQAMAGKNQCKPIVVSGPSGGGKSTLLNRLFKDYPGCFAFSVSRKYVVFLGGVEF